MTEDIINRIQNRESFLLAADGQFIGKLTTNIYDIESICNQYGSVEQINQYHRCI
jgi:hypothetical protein